MKIPHWIKEAYKGTDVHWSRSQSDIHRMLNDLGVYDVRFTNLKDRFALEFLITLGDGTKPRSVKIVTPLKDTGENDDKRTRELNIMHRILVAHIKAKFVAIGRGLTEFEQEFMAHLVIVDKDGNSKTMGEMLLPQYNKQIDEGNGQDFKLLN